MSKQTFEERRLKELKGIRSSGIFLTEKDKDKLDISINRLKFLKKWKNKK